MRFRFGVWLVVMLGFANPLFSGEARPVDLESFQTVWETIRDKHWDLAGTGADWDQVYRDYLPRAKKADSRAAMRGVIQAMIGELGQSHFNILGEATSSAMKDIEAMMPSGNARPGFRVSVIHSQVFIVSMDRDGPAAKAGLKVGDEILRLGKMKMKSLLKKIRKAFGDSAHAPLYIKRSLNQLFYGEPGQDLTFGILRDRVRTQMRLTLTKPKGRFINLLSLPSTYYQYDSDILPDNIGYLRFNIWVPQVKQAFEKESLPAMTRTQGLIIDLRGNSGGLGILAISLANKLVSKTHQKLGTMRNGGTAMNFPVFPQKPIYTKPLAILIDEGSASTSEIFAAGLQDLGRARIFGVRSAGATLPSLIEALPNGDLFQYAMADYISSSGRKLEGAGVIPDQSTPHTLETLSRGEDATLLAARRWIKNQTSKGEMDE